MCDEFSVMMKSELFRAKILWLIIVDMTNNNLKKPEKMIAFNARFLCCCKWWVFSKKIMLSVHSRRICWYRIDRHSERKRVVMVAAELPSKWVRSIQKSAFDRCCCQTAQNKKHLFIYRLVIYSWIAAIVLVLVGHGWSLSDFSMLSTNSSTFCLSVSLSSQRTFCGVACFGADWAGLCVVYLL